MLVGQKGQLQFGADAVGAADQDRLFDTGKVRCEQAAESANVRYNAFCRRARYVLFHELDSFVTSSDVNSGSCISI